MTTYTPIKLGNGHKVHAGRECGTYIKRGTVRKDFRSICSTTNTQNVNNHLRVYELPTNTPITCALCLDIMAKRAQEAKS